MLVAGDMITPLSPSITSDHNSGVALYHLLVVIIFMQSLIHSVQV